MNQPVAALSDASPSPAPGRIARSCPACASGEHDRLDAYSRAGWSTVRCKPCGFVFLSEAPRYEALSEELAWTGQFRKERTRRKEKEPFVAWLDEATRWRLHMLRDNEWDYLAEKVASGRVLDVGCGRANRIPGRYVPFGIEIEKAAAETADAEMRASGGRVVHAPALEGLSQFDEGFFDGIIMRSYLEHEMQPREVLDASFRALRPGGAIYVKVPNFATVNRVVRGVDWCGFRFPDHLNYFDIAGLKAMATACGFRFELKNRLTRYTNDNLHAFLVKPS